MAAISSAPLGRVAACMLERMDLPPHQRTQCAVDQLMTLNRAFAFELRGDDYGFEMRIVVRSDMHLRAGQPGLDQ